MMMFMAAIEFSVKDEMRVFWKARHDAYEALSEDEKESYDSIADMEEADMLQEQVEAFYYFF